MKLHSIRAYAILTILILLILTPIAVGAKSPTTIKQQVHILHNRGKVNFVYDATINVEQKYNGPSIEKMSLQKALKTLFDDTGITFEQRGNYIILRKRVSHTIETKVQRHHTLSGYIRDGNGESLINATVYDLTTRSEERRVGKECRL